MSVIKRKDGRWQVSFRDQDGKPRTRAFPKGRIGKRDAEAFDLEIKLLKMWEEPLPVRSKSGGEVFFDDIGRRWLAYKRSQGRSSRWLDEAKVIINKFFLVPLSEKPAAQVTMDDVLAIVSANFSEKSQRTRNLYVWFVKTIFAHAMTLGLVKSNPLANWKKGREIKRTTRLELDGLRRIKEIAPPHLAWAIEVAWNIPARPGPSDLFSLKFEAVDFQKGGINVSHSKVGRTAWVPLSGEFLAALDVRSRMHKSGYLIEYKGKPVRRMDTSLDRAARMAKLGHPVCMYDIRHLWITTMLDSGASPSALAEMAGTSIEMIMRHYYELNRREKDLAVTLLPRLDEDKAPGKVVNILSAKNRM